MCAPLELNHQANRGELYCLPHTALSQSLYCSQTNWSASLLHWVTFWDFTSHYVICIEAHFRLYYDYIKRKILVMLSFSRFKKQCLNLMKNATICRMMTQFAQRWCHNIQSDDTICRTPQFPEQCGNLKREATICRKNAMISRSMPRFPERYHDFQNNSTISRTMPQFPEWRNDLHNDARLCRMMPQFKDQCHNWELNIHSPEGAETLWELGT